MRQPTKKCYDCNHCEMCAWRKEVGEQGCEFFDNGNQWIPCSERLPEKDEEVIVYLFGDSPYLAWFDGLEWQTEDFTIEDDEKPTAWMPLPEGWKGEKDDD